MGRFVPAGHFVLVPSLQQPLSHCNQSAGNRRPRCKHPAVNNMRKNIVALLLCGTLMCAIGRADKVSPDLRRLAQGTTVNVIVQQKPGLLTSLLGLVRSLGGT